jgi:murein DD-endopeptidase MepM/ murein hydrolase activator NlpD
MPRSVSTLVSAALATLVVAGLSGCATARRADRLGGVPTGWPVARKAVVVTSEFGAQRRGSHHEGIDLSAPAGTPVKATAGGVVTFAGRSGRFGHTIVVDHGSGWQTRYAHLERIKVDRGDPVTRGDVIGTVGRTGNATGFHLHYEVLRNGSPVDPRPYLARS